jgi:GntR family transcriptional repressor for pyruvate dehydrogenase complex
MSFGPIKPKKVADAVFEQLRARLEDGSLAPGDRLPSERELAEQMRVSRPVVREAINMLVGQGLLEIRSRRGVFVRAAAAPGLGDPLTNLIGDSLDRLIELLEVRRMLESQTAALAAEFASPRDIEDLAALIAEFERVHRDRSLGEGTDARFHGRIAQAAGNTVLMHLMATLHKALTRSSLNVASRFQASDLYRETILQQHRGIFEAIRGHDPLAARARMQEHLDYVMRELRYHVRRGSEPMEQRAAS